MPIEEAAAFFAASTCADASPAVQQKIASVQYLVGTWNCSHTVGTFSGTYTTTYAKALGDLWLKQTYDFPPEQTAKSEPGVHAEYFMGFDERRQAWVRFGVWMLIGGVVASVAGLTMSLRSSKGD